ncbi:hypothetical protein CYMTET_48004 [Cymbomonas tetramitiformis]|uniref:Uncharacterized protein n=1 Tax=Cymbomonas tetramitiformis TaxID=36881 RepID=A0AAE0EW61_9CHLO|nr:hypothetical protein CYMTET_48004 [Cymbomonas tetramitiformis]
MRTKESDELLAIAEGVLKAVGVLVPLRCSDRRRYPDGGVEPAGIPEADAARAERRASPTGLGLRRPVDAIAGMK